MNKDLTIGNPTTVLWKFCLPLFLSIIFQQLYNLADSFVAGKFIGEYALAAVGNSYEVTLIFIAFAFGCNIGCSVIVSQFFGAKKYGNMKTAVYTSFIASGILCLLLMATGIIFCKNILSLIHTAPEILSDSKLYLDIYIFGLPFVFFYHIATGVFSALGDSKTPFFFLAASSVSNIGINILFVTVFRMGVAGVAWATFLCQGVSCILALLTLFRRLKKIKTETPACIFSFSIFKKIAKIAIPSIIQQCSISVGNIIIQGIINSFGVSVTDGYAAGVKLNNLVTASLVTIGNGISNYTAQNIGAGKPLRIKQGFSAGVGIMLAIVIPLAIIYFVFGKWLLLLFLDTPSGVAMDTAVLFLRILSPCYLLLAFKLTADGILRGSSIMIRFMITTITDFLLRVVFALLLSKTTLGATGIWCAWPVGWLIATGLSVLFYALEIRKRTAQKNLSDSTASSQ